jgi:hypothetical protein
MFAKAHMPVAWQHPRWAGLDYQPRSMTPNLWAGISDFFSRNTQKSSYGVLFCYNFRGMFFKLLNNAHHVKTFNIRVALKYQINLFFKFVIIKTQLIIL